MKHRPGPGLCVIAAEMLLCGAALAQAATPPAAGHREANVSQGAAVDVVPWGERTVSADGKEVLVLWEDQRDVCRVVAVFGGPAPDPAAAHLEWWQSQWPERRIPRDQLSGAGGSGWLNVGDWYQGRWREADARLDAAGNTWTWTFRPVNAKEFANLKDFAASYRTTMKLRLRFDAPGPKVEALRAFSDSTWKSAECIIQWGGAAQDSQVWDGRLEVFNGYAQEVRPLATDGGVRVAADGSWRSEVKGRTAGIRARIWLTESPNVNTFDRTIVTVRAKQHSFSFDARHVAEGGRVFAPIYGVLVRRADDAIDYAAAMADWKKRTDKPIYERVFEQPEQTFARAWSDMPPKRQFYIPLGCEGGRQRFGVEPDGSVFCRNDRIDHPRGRDTPRRTWGGNSLHYGFGLPPGTPRKRWIEDGCLPIIHAQWQRDGVLYTQTAFATRLEPGGLGWPDMQADDTTVLVMQILCENRGDGPAAAALEMSLRPDGRAAPLTLRGGLVFAGQGGGEVLRCAVEAGARMQLAAEAGKVRFTEPLAPGAKTAVVAKIPFITLDLPAELERLGKMTFAAEFDRVRTFWRGRADAGCQVRTPVPEISNFYRAHVSHLLINCGREVGADRLMARVGSFGYGVYGNESCMMITDLDRRGMHREAERCLETFLHYQGTSPLPGDYASQEGVFNGAGGWESGGYNQHHGWILWAMAEHYRYTGDRAWLGRSADRLVKGCRWIISERSRTKAFAPGSLRGIERGLLPPGSLEDIGDWRCWLSNNNFSWWGLDAVAGALADVGHPEAKALRAEADAYRADMLAAWREAMVRSPLVSLRDGTWVPAIPSEVHRRGRTFGWITVTLEGPIYLIRTGAIAPDDPLARCIMQDYEDNLYLSEQYGYSPSHVKEHWFSRGGFSMQPNLLCSPHPYLARDEIGHFLRSYFNAFAVTYYPNTQMLTEHPLPEMGDWRGDHYKSSDESNSTYWLRLMFIDERGPDLYLGMAVPREWLTDGRSAAIERAATHFGPMSLRYESRAARGEIAAVLDPPVRQRPERAFLRFRHPQGRPITRVTIDGKPWERFDAKREWVELPPFEGRTTIVARYAD
jgi:hypothetical protein